MLWIFQPFCNHTLPLSLSLSVQVFSPSTLPSSPTLYPAGPPAAHTGCDCTTLLAAAEASWQVWGSAKAAWEPLWACMHRLPSLRNPCLAEGVHSYSQDMAAAQSYTGTGTSLVVATVSFLLLHFLNISPSVSKHLFATRKDKIHLQMLFLVKRIISRRARAQIHPSEEQHTAKRSRHCSMSKSPGLIQNALVWGLQRKCTQASQ